MKTPAEVAAEILEAMQIPDGQRCTFTRDGNRCVNPRLAPDSVFCPGHAYLYGDAKINLNHPIDTAKINKDNEDYQNLCDKTMLKDAETRQAGKGKRSKKRST